MAEQTPPTPGRWWARRGFVVAAVVLGVIIVIAATVFVTDRMRTPVAAPPPSTAPSGSEPTTEPTTEPTPAPSSGSEDPGGAGASLCGLTDVRTSGTVATTPETKWDLVGTMSVPTSTTQGPGKKDSNGYRYCFAHTPEGALFAAGNVFGAGTRPAYARSIAEHSTAKGPGRNVLLKQPVSSEDSDTSIRVQLAGFKVLSYDGSKATIDLAFRTSQGSSGAWAYELVWEDGDWKMVVTDTGELPNKVVQLQSLDGYVSWGNG